MHSIQKNIGFILGGIFLLCFIILSVAEYRGMHAEYQEAWRVEFVDPMSRDLTFQVQNDTQKGSFAYTVFADKKTIAQGSFEIQAGETKKVSLEGMVSDPAVLQGKVRIRIKDATGGEREIFKIFSKEE